MSLIKKIQNLSFQKQTFIKKDKLKLNILLKNNNFIELKFKLKSKKY